MSEMWEPPWELHGDGKTKQSISLNVMLMTQIELNHTNGILKLY